MVSGCTIVSTVDLGQKGILIKPKSSKDIVNAIKYFIENKEKAGLKFGKENFRLARNFTWKNFFDNIVRIIQGLQFNYLKENDGNKQKNLFEFILLAVFTCYNKKETYKHVIFFKG